VSGATQMLQIFAYFKKTIKFKNGEIAIAIDYDILFLHTKNCTASGRATEKLRAGKSYESKIP
jgi:hypothetical protein